MKTQQITQKTVPKEPIDYRVLGTFISIAQHSLSPVGGYREITDFIRNKLGKNVSEDDVIRHFSSTIALQEAELMYRQYGY